MIKARAFRIHIYAVCELNQKLLRCVLVVISHFVT